MNKFVILILLTTSFFSSFGQAFKIDEFEKDSNYYASPIKVVNQIQLIGNKITKPQIILREVSFMQGDTLANEAFLQAMAQSKKNILNTSLFNFTKLELAFIDTSHVIVIITVVERWYIFPLPIFEIDDNNFNTWWRDRDYSRINYGMHLSVNNFRGRKEKLSMTAKYGFTERYRIRYSVPFIDKKQKIGMSMNFSFNRRDEIVYTTFNNERLLYKNFDRDAIRNYASGLSLSYRNKIFNSHVLGIGYSYNTIVDSVRLLNPNFLGRNRVEADYISLGYSFIHDKRDSRNYPLKGRYISFTVQKIGLGIADDFIDLTNFHINAKKYLELKDRVYFASSFRGLLTVNNNQPYLLQSGLGYSSFAIRSYEYYVIDGQNIGLAKAQLKYQIVKPRSANLGFITEKFGKFHYSFYLGIFTDAAYVEDNIGFPQNNLANELQYGHGIGLDFVSYYDIVLRSEFSINKFGESGLFFHFVAPI